MLPSGYRAGNLNIGQLPVAMMSVQGKVRCLMNQVQIWFDLITGIYHRLDANKIPGFKGISQGLLEDDMELADTGVLFPKNLYFDYDNDFVD